MPFSVKPRPIAPLRWPHVPPKRPIAGMFCCCARAARSHAGTPPARRPADIEPASKSRRFMQAYSQAQLVRCLEGRVGSIRLWRAANAVTLRFRDQPGGIVGQQEAFGHEVVGGLPESCHIGLLGRIAFLDRGSRISGRKPLMFGRCKRNEAATKRAESVFEVVLVELIPSGVGPDRNCNEDVA